MAYGSNGNIEMIKRELSSVYHDLPNQTDKFIFIRELMMHVAAIKGKHNEDINRSLPADKHHAQRMLDGLIVGNHTLDEFQYFLASLLVKDGYNLDKNAFSWEEFKEVDTRLDDIIRSLDHIEASQEVLFEEFEAQKSFIRNEFESLRSNKVIGKKNFYQLALGKICSYTGNKIADQIFVAIKPQIVIFFAAQAPHLVETIQHQLK
jgi:hypothetical protein